MRAGVAEPEAEVVREGPLEPGLEHARPRPPVRALAREDDERRRRVVPRAARGRDDGPQGEREREAVDVDGERSSSLRESSSSEPPSLGLTRGAPIGVPRGNRGSLPIGGSHAIAMERARSGDEPEDMRD